MTEPQKTCTSDIVNTLAQKIAVNILKQPRRILKPDEPLISSGVIDSFSLVDVALLVEDTYGVHVDDAELNAETFDTLNQLAELVRARQA
jgi:acyl carrier protein